MKEANQIAALPAAVAVEDILLCVDVERGPALLMQRTETHILPAARRPANPVLLPQVLQQGHSPSACLDILAQVFAPLKPSLGRAPLRFQGKDGGRVDFLYAHGPEDFESRNDPGQRCGLLSARVTTPQPVSHAR